MDEELKKDLIFTFASVLGALAVFLIVLIFASCDDSVYIMGYNNKLETAETVPADSNQVILEEET